MMFKKGIVSARVSRMLIVVLGAAAPLAATLPAQAVIKVDLPLSRIYDTARAVVVGRLSSLDAERKVVEVSVTDTAKGESPGPMLRVQVLAPPGLFDKLAVDQPLVMFVDKGREGRSALVHLADTWLLAQRLGDAAPQAWRVVQLHDAKQSFPRRTAALAGMVGQIKAGKYPLLDRMEQACFGGGVRRLAKLEVTRADFLAAADLTGSGKIDLLVETADRVRLFAAGGGGFAPAWAADASTGGPKALGDVNGDGRLDLLAGKRLWLNQGRGFSPGMELDLPQTFRPLALALVDVTGDQKPDAVFLAATGELRIFQNPGSVNQPWPALPERALWKDDSSAAAAFFGRWGEDGRKTGVMVVRESGIWRYMLDGADGPPADFERLTGVDLRKYYKRYRDGLKNPLALALDANGDSRPDLLVVCDTGALLMINRGFGAFLVDYDAGAPFLSNEKNRLPFKPSPATPWTAADMRGDKYDDLLILSQDAQLYHVSNPPPREQRSP